METRAVVSLDERWPQVGLDGVVIRIRRMEADVEFWYKVSCIIFEYKRRRLIDEGPSESNRVLDIFDEPVTRLQAWIIEQGGPDLIANVLSVLRKIERVDRLSEIRS